MTTTCHMSISFMQASQFQKIALRTQSLSTEMRFIIEQSFSMHARIARTASREILSTRGIDVWYVRR
jgi:hypothetical protein